MKFKFNINREYTIWQREKYEIEAKNKGEAFHKIVEQSINPSYKEEDGFKSNYYITESECLMLPTTSHSTMEILDEQGKQIYKNQLKE